MTEPCRILQGDALDTLRTLPDAIAQTCITSPPYWGLRDYGTATWDGGSDACDHRQQLGGEGKASAKQNTSVGTQTVAYRDICGKCGARRIDSQIGLEPTPEAYVSKLVEVFRVGENEVYRVVGPGGETLVPALQGVVREIDLEGKRMVVDYETEDV